MRKLSFVLLCLCFFTSCDLRTSSKIRLEQVSDVKLPDDFDVFNDEYQDMGPDYCLFYKIRFDKKASSEFIKSVKKSRFYLRYSNTDILVNSNAKINTLPVWYKSNTGYGFIYKKGLTDYIINFNISDCTLNYQECAD